MQIVKQLLLLGAFLQREAGRLLTDYGLNQQQFVVLKEIQEKGPINQKELCSFLLFEKSNVSKIVKKLETDGLIRTASAPGDSRVTLLSITKKGNAVVQQCMERLNRWNAEWLGALSEKELTRIGAALDALSNLTG